MATRIKLELPPKSLHPNRRATWQAKMRERGAYRKSCCGAGLAEVHVAFDGVAPCWAAATVRLVYHFGGGRSQLHDPDNLIAWGKTSIDGLVDAGIFADDRGLVWLPAEQDRGAVEPWLEVVIDSEACGAAVAPAVPVAASASALASDEGVEILWRLARLAGRVDPHGPAIRDALTAGVLLELGELVGKVTYADRMQPTVERKAEAEAAAAAGVAGDYARFVEASRHRFCWICGEAERPAWWAGPWALERAHIVNKPRVEDVRAVVILCTCCHRISHGERFGGEVGRRSVCEITVGNLLAAKERFDLGRYDLEFLACRSIRKLAEAVIPAVWLSWRRASD